MSAEEDIPKLKDMLKVSIEGLRERGVSVNLGELGLSTKTSQPDLASRHRREDENVTLFERSTPAERLRLYQEDPQAWQEMMDAHEQAGLRKLFGSPGNIPR